MVGIADLGKFTQNTKKCIVTEDGKYCYFHLQGLNTYDLMDMLNYKAWVHKTYQKAVTIRYVNLVRRLEKGNATIRTSIGFGPLMMRYLNGKGFRIRDQDMEMYRARGIIFPTFKLQLWDFQQRMVDDWARAGGIGVIKAPTGAGKSIIGADVIKRIERKTLILVHTSDLLINVWTDSLQKCFGSSVMNQIGIVGGGLSESDRLDMRVGVRTNSFSENMKRDIVIATFQTLNHHLEELSKYKFGLMLCDECIPIDSKIWTQNGIIKYEDLSSDNNIYQVWSSDKDSNIVNNVYKKVTTKFKHMYRNIVESGDELVCSLDHKILSKLSDGRLEYIEIEKAKNIGKSLLRPYDMKKNSILARLYGYILGDGWIDVNYSGGAGGDSRGLYTMSNDIKILNYLTGTGRSSMSGIRNLESTIQSVKYGELKVKGTVDNIRLDQRLTDKLIDLGMPIGRKPNQEFYVPEWIMNGNKEIKREFLAGYIGAEASNPGFRGDSGRKTLKKSFFVPRLSLNKRVDLINKGLIFAEQIKKLLKELEVEVSDIKVIEGNIRKDGTITKKIIITIGNKFENLKKYFEIGCRYATDKEKEMESIKLFFGYVDECNNERKYIQDKVLEYYNRGFINKQKIITMVNNSRTDIQKDIMSSWGLEEENKKVIKKKYLVRVTEGMTSDIIHPHKREDGTDQIAKTAMLKEGMDGFNEWRKRIKGDFIFLDILRHEYRGYEQGYTLTVNKDHNYLVNGFCHANCHHVPANMFRKVNSVLRAPYKLGLSATVTRLDGMEKDCFGQLGDIQSKVSIRELINKGLLTEPRFQSPIIVDQDVIEKVNKCGLGGLNLSRFIKKASASSEMKMNYIVDVCKKIAMGNRKFLLFTDYVNAEDVYVRDFYADRLLDEGIPVQVIDQGMKADERGMTFNLLEQGQISGIVFGKLGSEGVNIPSVDVVIMCNGLKSPITYTQRVGRAMRKIPGKEFADVYEVLMDIPMELKWSEFNFQEYRAEGFQKTFYKIE